MHLENKKLRNIGFILNSKLSKLGRWHRRAAPYLCIISENKTSKISENWARY
jgi:hypothetical protein